MQSDETKQLVERIFRFNKLMHNEMSQITDCSTGELKMLSVIGSEQERNEQEGNDIPGITVSKISERLMHSRPATSKMLNALEEKGDITRISSKKDRRAVYIALTDKGRNRAEELKSLCEERTNRIFERLGQEKSAQLFELMDDIYGILQDMRMEEIMKLKKEK